MSQEQEATLSGLRTAIQMEIDGKEFYLKAGKASRNELGSKLMKQLAEEEDVHRRVFEKIYTDIKNKKNWPEHSFKPDGGHKLQTVFKAAMEKVDRNVNPMPGELDAVKTAIDMENKTLDFYRERSSRATYEAERQLYDSLAGEESGHQRALVDYYEFFQDPAQYFVKTEHTSVDGG